jgi:hypothetical protein
MSDYFGALMRSAGTLPAHSPPGVVMRDGAATHTPREDALAQIEPFEVFADVPPAHALPTQTEAPAQPAAGARPDVADREQRLVAPRPSTAVEQSITAPDPTAVQAPARSTPAMPSAALFGPQAALHPAVRSALQWVADGPDPPPSRAAEAAAPPAAASLHDHRPASQSLAAASRVEPPAMHMSEPLEVERPAPRVHAKGLAPEPPSIGHDMALAWPTSRPQQAAMNSADPDAPPGEQRVDVSIGTIHVRVEAPPPRVTAQATPPAARQAPPRPAQRSAFARCRLPRI